MVVVPCTRHCLCTVMPVQRYNYQCTCLPMGPAQACAGTQCWLTALSVSREMYQQPKCQNIKQAKLCTQMRRISKWRTFPPVRRSIAPSSRNLQRVACACGTGQVIVASNFILSQSSRINLTATNCKKQIDFSLIIYHHFCLQKLCSTFRLGFGC